MKRRLGRKKRKDKEEAELKCGKESSRSSIKSLSGRFQSSLSEMIDKFASAN